jgi:DNA polymerase-3 subunit delta
VAAPEPGGRRRRSLTPSEELEQYLQAPEPMTTLVFAAGALDANRRLVKLLRKHGVVVDCGSLETTADAQRWIDKQLERDEVTIEPQAVKLLLETTGLSLGRIRAELEKLVLFSAGESKITAKHVRELVTPASEPEEDFALGKAIWNGNARKALAEVAALLDTGSVPVMVLGQIRAAVGRLQPDDRARHALDLVFQIDEALKSSGGEPRYLLERLIIEVCGRPVVR